MASQQRVEDEAALAAAYEDGTPTPAGWKRKLIPRIGKGMVAVQTDVVFIAPGGEEFKSRAQLQRYLKANKGGPTLSEFIWVVDGAMQSLTRSKSALLVKPLEFPSRAVSKRKSNTDTKEVESEKRRLTGKAQKPVEDPKGAKGSNAKNADTMTVKEQKNKGNDATTPAQASSKMKRGGKAAVDVNAPLVANSTSTNGPTEASKKEEKIPETVKDTSSEKAGNKRQSKGRTKGKKGASSRAKRQSKADVPNSEGDDNVEGEEENPEDVATTQHDDETPVTA